MDKESEPFTLPPSPKGLCFDKNQFLGNSFSVDTFLHEHRNAGSLEIMRDDLGVYLKVLRSAMIELINKDYADFVSLAANLIGLDKDIDSIRAPLGQLREQVLHVKECLSDAMKELSGRLEQRRILRERKRNLQYLSQAQTSLQKLTKLLATDTDCKDTTAPEFIERASSEYNKLQFTITKCGNFITQEQKNTADNLGAILRKTLGEMFLENLRQNKMDKVQRCLQIFSTLDRVSDVEALLRKEVIAPALHEIISESALQRHPAGLRGVCTDILTLLDERLTRLLSLTRRGTKGPSVEGYDFLLNSFWPEVEYRIEVHMSSVFAPGNPELFYSRYGESLEFIGKFLQYFEDRKAIERFYVHPQYKSFQHRWNLPVYFQIRFQEIAGAMETVLSEPINSKCILSETGSGKELNLKASTVCWSSLLLCWAEGVFVLALAHRFWKLSLQILARYTTWVNLASKQVWTSPPEQNSSHNGDKTNNCDRLKFVVFLHVDINNLIHRLPTFLELVLGRLRPLRQAEALDKSLGEARAALLAALPQLRHSVVAEIASRSIVHLKQLNDIPRLFRKTNRDMPSECCGYVGALVKDPLDFCALYKDHIGEQYTIHWLEAIFSIITKQYYVAMDDVLTSVHKTEESLRRLKLSRERPALVPVPAAQPGAVTDDDKIRRQLQLDVRSYAALIAGARVEPAAVARLAELGQLVDKAAPPAFTPMPQ